MIAKCKLYFWVNKPGIPLFEAPPSLKKNITHTLFPACFRFTGYGMGPSCSFSAVATDNPSSWTQQYLWLMTLMTGENHSVQEYCASMHPQRACSWQPGFTGSAFNPEDQRQSFCEGKRQIKRNGKLFFLMDTAIHFLFAELEYHFRASFTLWCTMPGVAHMHVVLHAVTLHAWGSPIISCAALCLTNGGKVAHTPFWASHFFGQPLCRVHCAFFAYPFAVFAISSEWHGKQIFAYFVNTLL